MSKKPSSPETLGDIDLKSLEIPSTDGKKTYTVAYSLNPLVVWECSCPHFYYRNKCKHTGEIEDFLKNF